MIKYLLLLCCFTGSTLLLAQPITDFEAAPLNACVGEEIQFSDLSTSSNTIISWNWDFGDGSTSASQNPTHSYTNSGDYTIILTAQDANGAEAEVKINYLTINPLPSPSFNTNIIGGCSAPSDVSISNVQPNSGVSYNWNFGNGTTSSSATPNDITYTNAGSYDISLVVTDNSSGCSDTVVQTVDIYDYQTSFTASSTTVCVGETINFTDNSSAGTDTWNWNFGDGSNENTQNPTHSYASDGIYTVSLNATNTTNNCSNTETISIEVLPLPQPSLTAAPQSGCAPLTVDFTNTSSGGGAFEWNFGDGGTFTGQSPSTHTYTANGTYSVTLTQTDANGCEGSTNYTNIINVSSINPDFEADVLEGCEDLDVTFTNLSVSPNSDDPITSWTWDFGNGNTYNGETPPTQTYSEGLYDVTLTISTNGGCSESITFDEYIKVGIPPNADFSWTPPQDCAKSDFDFTNLTTISVPFDPSEVVYEWDFGDGGTASDENPTYQYPQDTGYFDVQLIVKFRECPDTMTYTDAVYIDAPIANFKVTTVYCNPTLPLEVVFDDEAIIGKETDNAEMIWDWGDGSTTTVTPPSLYNDNPGQVRHTYTNLGSYTIQQAVYNQTTGCTDSITNTIHLSNIDAQFNFSNDSTCINDPISFSDNGSTSTHPLNSYSYNFNDGTIINNANTTYTYTIPGTYTVTYTVSNIVGCQDTQELIDFEALALPTANISPSVNAGCSPLNVIFTNNSTNPSGVPLDYFDWTFEDGSTTTTNTINQTTDYDFNTEGVFTTELIATDEFGCVSPPATIQTVITKPSADFIIPAVVCNDELFTAENTSSNFSSSEWFINTQSETTNTDLTTSFNHQNSSTNLSTDNEITLIVTDANGCKDTLIDNITVSTPYADFDFVFSGANVNNSGEFVCPPVFTDLTDLSGSIGNITNWSWDFSDGKTSTLENPNNTYVFAGTYSGSLIITDEFGCSDTMVYEDYLEISGPSGSLKWELQDICKKEFLFTPYDLDGVSEISWAMDNGDTINSIDAFNYIYDQTGVFTPTAILKNDDNCNIPYILDPITIIEAPLNPYFEINPMAMNWGETAIFSESSTGGFGGIVDWSWNTESEQFNNNGGVFDYLFNSSGEVTTTLVVTDSAGCQAEYEVTVNIFNKYAVPNILTANNDGTNDIFKLIDNPFKSYTVIILNRWGNVVSEQYVVEDDYLWDGLNKRGEECTDGVYFYKIDGIQRDGKERTEHGYVHLHR